VNSKYSFLRLLFERAFLEKSGLGLGQKELKKFHFTSVQCDHAQCLREKGCSFGDLFSSLVPVVQVLECDSKSKSGK